MKNAIFISLICMYLLLAACQQKVDYDAEAKAIKEVIMHETNSYSAQDYPGVVSSFVRDSTVIRMSTGVEGHKVWMGWHEKLEPYYKKSAEADWSDFEILERKWTNWKIKVYPESAWAVYNQHTRYSYMEEEGKSKSCEIRFLEKEGGKWRIVMLHWIDLVSFEEAKEAEEAEASE
jgi:hypothetical protein